jgi:hypothetical protein
MWLVFMCFPARGCALSWARTGVAINAPTAAAAARSVTFFILVLLFEGRNKRRTNTSLFT